MISVVTAAIWLVFAAAGIEGLRLQYPGLLFPRSAATPVTFQRINVNVVKAETMLQRAVAVTPRQSLPEPRPPQPIALPALVPVADPKLNLPYPMVVKTPSQIAPAVQAVPLSASSVKAAAAAAPVERLIFGKGEGDQPAPEYPDEARLAHQQGDVVVQMTIAENGDVTDAKVSSPSPWPILNQAAVRVVRDSWHFPPGPVRHKEIDFDFQLNQR